MPPRRHAGRLLAAIAPLLLLGFLAAPAEAATRRSRVTTTTAVPAPRYPKAWILVDADTGRVLDEHDDHVLRRPASVVKLLTVLTALRVLRNDAEIHTSALAASMPARKIGLQQGDTWPLSDILDSVLVVSANDAAVALAEAAGGDLDRFGQQMAETARALGVVDSPTFGDPAGLDDNFSAGGGDWISAWDLAVIGLAALHEPAIMSRASSPIVRFTDTAGHAHRLVNHNKLLTMYPGANGLKTGYTKAAGNTLVASATRDGRTMLAVLLDAPDMYKSAIALLDRGFATEAATETGPTIAAARLASAPASVTAHGKPIEIARRAGSASFGRDEGEWILLALAAIGVAVVEAARRRRRRTRPVW